MEHVLVTGGAGFIGSHFVKRLITAEDVARVTVLDALTYAGHVENLGTAFFSDKLRFVHGNVQDADLVNDVMASGPTAVVHFAAESHVGRSYGAAREFLSTNALGTQVLVDAAHRHTIGKFVHVSTDEVYGPLVQGSATEQAALRPSVPYAVSKAAGDLVALGAYQTLGLPVCVTRSSNNYGPYQYPEKIIPLFLTRLLRGMPVTLHDRGQHVRNWLHVEDNCAGIEAVLRDGKPGEVYNLGGGADLSSKDLTGYLLAVCGATWDAVTYIPDRPANDIRYSIDWAKARDQLGYRPKRRLEDGLAETAEWYRRNPDRWAPIARGKIPAVPLARTIPSGKGSPHA
ncbi:putative NAD-dependent epimerase/dehydratase (plasmid) [Streptomyces sp. Tu6071]|uniref:dTDP-glucose 4,6-dehydratase n=1 Tax=Streptomyces sp. Tu6071 TaxID=355249 RepID=UPI00020E6A53|nr:dTDP-glucose 4,6-dehydratase [Streptomyces sp. Tu6071]EGJ72675.1 putative NAD-dependent epimerase/dehydratase [Streptomyces sp. Tu6071]